MDEKAIRNHILDALKDAVPGSEPAAMDPEVSFRDQIEMDSVDFLDFILDLEKRLGMKIPESEYPRLSSLNGCVRVVHAHLRAAAAP